MICSCFFNFMDNNTYFGLSSFHVKIAIWNPLYEIIVHSVNLFMFMDLSNHIILMLWFQSLLSTWYVVCESFHMFLYVGIHDAAYLIGLTDHSFVNRHLVNSLSSQWFFSPPSIFSGLIFSSFLCNK